MSLRLKLTRSAGTIFAFLSLPFLSHESSLMPTNINTHNSCFSCYYTAPHAKEMHQVSRRVLVWDNIVFGLMIRNFLHGSIGVDGGYLRYNFSHPMPMSHSLLAPLLTFT
ncbi:hypothetical protein EV421DRAFT_1792425 [Armillaria borealis]|uniref:Uncharacterized protein n=1 Tax=Armillaria borealis TaxID=47425 RepID=A0AA39MTK5_9AGAR|nr:hypothetical protein EV421DRAFT_1792425 [Armillaria borealis]